MCYKREIYCIHDFLTDDNNEPLPVHNCSLRMFELLKNVDPNDADGIRHATPGFVQDMYKTMKKGSG